MFREYFRYTQYIPVGGKSNDSTDNFNYYPDRKIFTKYPGNAKMMNRNTKDPLYHRKPSLAATCIPNTDLKVRHLVKPF